MKNNWIKTQKHLLIMAGLVTIAVGCKKEEISPKNESATKPNENQVITKSLPYGATINSLALAYLNDCGTGFQNDSEYFSKDWSGDGITDIMMRASNGNMYFYKGNSNSPDGPYPDKVGDNLNNVTYTLNSGATVGSGWNFSRYFPADYNGDNKCDMLAQNPDGNLWLYIWNGTGFSSGVQQVRLGQAGAWSLTSQFIPVDVDGDSNFEILEVTDNNIRQTWKRGTGNTWTSYAFNSSLKTLFGNDDQYFPINIDGDSDIDLFILKSNGNLYYSKSSGLTGGFSTPTQCGTGWDSFTNVYGSYHWSCWTPIASLTGRNSNGELISYKWNSSSNTFSSGVVIGTGWNFDRVLVGNFCADISARQDFIGLTSTGILKVYTTLAILN